MLVGHIFIEELDEENEDEEMEEYWDEYDFEEPEKWGARNRRLGDRGEDAAANYLERMGYEILERNWTCPAGEADIIARQGRTVVFIEVKTRTGVEKGLPAEAVDEKKRSRYEKIAAYYLRDYDDVDMPFRFDVIALLVIGINRAIIRHYVNAFGSGW